MALNQRRIKILELIREDGHAKVQELSKIFSVTEVTIRQDLEFLEKLGYIQREHGGAFLKDVGSFAKTGKLVNQEQSHEEKVAIARKAVTYINDDDVIILDSGSTTTEIAKLLLKYNRLTVITNALNIALILGENPGINLIVTGGEFKAPTLSLTGDSFLIQPQYAKEMRTSWSRARSGSSRSLKRPLFSIHQTPPNDNISDEAVEKLEKMNVEVLKA